MPVVYGTRLFGETDIVPGLFHVATKFGHIDYFPLIPLGTYLVLARSGDEFHGVRIPLRPRSLILAWARALAVFATFWTSLFLGVVLTSERAEPWAWVDVAIWLAVCLAVLHTVFRNKHLTHASYDRGRELGELIGLKDAGWALIEQHYGFDGVAPDPA